MKTMEKRAKKFLLEMTKAVMGIAVITVCFLMMTLSSHAYTQTTGTVIPATAKIRAEANTGSGVVGSTAAGKTVTITDEVKAADGSVWYQVIVDAATKGYIRSDLVNKAGAATPPAATPAVTPTDGKTPAAAPASAAPATVTDMEWQSGKISTKSGRIRKDASTSADLVASASRGTVVTVTGKTTGDDGKEWYKVSFTYNGATISGFIRSDLVTFGELPEESPDPAVTEIEGKKEDTTKKEGDAEETGTEAGTEEGTTQTVSDNAVAPPAAEPQPESPPAKSVTVLNAEETPVLPDGFKEVAVTLEEQEVRAWKNGDFYIFYGQSETGDNGYFMYDSIETNYQRYYMTNVDSVKKGGLSDTVMKVILIVLAVVVVALLVVVTFLAIKLNDYKSDSDWDDDDDDDPDDDDDFPEDEEEEEEVEKPLPKRVKKPIAVEEPRRRPQAGEEPRRRPQAAQEPRRRPQSAEEPRRRPQAMEEPRRRPQTGEEPRRRPQTVGGAKNNPRNFLAVDEEEERKTAVKTNRARSLEPASSEFDPDDEDTFVFINLDGDQIK